MKVLSDMALNGDESQPRIGNLPPLGNPGSPDDRWVFTEDNPAHELEAAAGLAAASRALKGFNDPLSADCLRIARELWVSAKAPKDSLDRLLPAIELLQTTGEGKYADAVLGLQGAVLGHMDDYGWLGARSLGLVKDAAYTEAMRTALRALRTRVDAQAGMNPYGIPYTPDIWGAGWDIQRFGVQQYYLHAGAPDIFTDEYMLDAIAFVLGCHPGPNTASFVSGVGAKSLIPAYGMNRADWSYIPGGIASGTALIRPDFPELVDWPFLWQQREYCMGYSTSDYVFLILAAEHLEGN
jgi:hypothetical protein